MMRTSLLCSLLLLSAHLGAAGVLEKSVCKSVRGLGDRTKLLSRFANPFFGEHVSKKPEGPQDVAVLSVLYSPGRFVRPVLNLLLVQNRLDALGIPRFTLEVALGDEPHVLQPGPTTLLLRTTSCLFQKERLMNVLEATVPDRFTKVLYLDGDVMLANSAQGGAHWYDVLSKLLDSHDVVQPFDLSGHLDLAFRRVSRVKCSVLHAHHNASLDSQIPGPKPLHTGLAWAFRRDWLHAQGGLFDAAIHGGGDSINAGALGQYHVCLPRNNFSADPTCLGGAGRILVRSYMRQFQEYEARVATHPPRSAYAPTLVALDLWHGSSKNRQYTSRLAHFENVQNVDDLVRTDAQGIYEFRPGMPEAEQMNATICRYFQERVDDALTDHDPRARL